MTHPVVRDFEPEDLLRIAVADEVLGQRMNQNVLAWGETHKKAGPCFTLTVDERPVACGGFVQLWKGTGEMWATIDKEAGPGVVIAIRKQVEAWIEEYGLRRVHSITPKNWEAGKRFLEWLGMHAEGNLEKFGPNGVDQMMYARVSDG